MIAIAVAPTRVMPPAASQRRNCCRLRPHHAYRSKRASNRIATNKHPAKPAILAASFNQNRTAVLRSLSSHCVAHAYGTVKVLAEIKPGGDGQQRWDEVRWEGQPGDRSVWVVAPGGRARPQLMYRVALKGDGPLRQFLPYVPTSGYWSPAVKYPLNFLWFHEERGSGTSTCHEPWT